MAEIKTTVREIDRFRMEELFETMDGTTDRESLLMLCFALSLLYRGGMNQGMAIATFTDHVALQTKSLIEKPPEGFREEDIKEPTPGCDCDVCEAKRRYQKAKILAH